MVRIIPSRKINNELFQSAQISISSLLKEAKMLDLEADWFLSLAGVMKLKER